MSALARFVAGAAATLNRRLPRLAVAGSLTLAVAAVGATAGSAAAPQQPAPGQLPPEKFAEVASGVALIRTFNCHGKAIAEGSGFLVGSSVVVTARHVVDPPGEPAEKACRVKVNLAGDWVSVAHHTHWHSPGDDGRAEDLETLKLSHPVSGYIFGIRRLAAPPGTNLAMIGHPLGNPPSMTQGELVARRHTGGVPVIAVRLLGAEGASGAAIVDDNAQVVAVLQQGLGSKDALGQRTAGVVLGIDLSRWWGWRAERELCGRYPNGGIPGCGSAGVSPVEPPPTAPPGS